MNARPARAPKGFSHPMRLASLADALCVGRGDLVSLVGGGGKTTLMYRLAGELRSRGLRAAAATTTKIREPEGGSAARFVSAPTYEALLAGVSATREGFPVLGRERLPTGKVVGVPPEWCDRAVADGVLESLVVEADGAARRPVKAPEAWEPVVPAGTTVFAAVVGLSCLGKPLDAEVVFRPERFSVVTGLEGGLPLTAVALARLFLSGEGLLKGRPADARAVAFLNQADVVGATGAVAELVPSILRPGSPYERVVLGSLARKGSRFDVWTSPDKERAQPPHR